MYKSSMRRIRSSRANGARSRGPRSPQGKAHSSQNAVRHGLLSKCVVMAGESGQGFDALLQQHLARFAPADGVDQGYIEEMVVAAWRIRPLGPSKPGSLTMPLRTSLQATKEAVWRLLWGASPCARNSRYCIDTKPGCISAISRKFRKFHKFQRSPSNAHRRRIRHPRQPDRL